MSEMQNCREFKPLHPGSWAQASKIWFWTPVSRVQALYILPLCGWGTLGSWSSPGLFGGPWTCLGCLGCVGLPGALLGSPWGSPGAPWAAAVAPWGSGARSGLLVTLAFGCSRLEQCTWNNRFWIKDDMISALCASPQLPVGRIRGCWSGWWLGPLVD